METPPGSTQAAVLGLLAHLVAGEPAGVLDLLAVDVDVARLGAAEEPEHQRRRQRPGLVAEVA